MNVCSPFKEDAMRSLKTALFCVLLSSCATIQQNRCVQEIASSVSIDLAKYYCETQAPPQWDRLSKAQRECLAVVASLARKTSVSREILAAIIWSCVS